MWGEGVLLWTAVGHINCYRHHESYCGRGPQKARYKSTLETRCIISVNIPQKHLWPTTEIFAHPCQLLLCLTWPENANPRYTLTDDLMMTIFFIYTLVYYSAVRKSKIIKLVEKLKEFEIIILKMITKSHKDQCQKFLETFCVCLVKDHPESQKLSWWHCFVMKLYPDLYNFPLRATTMLFKWRCIFLMNQKGL